MDTLNLDLPKIDKDTGARKVIMVLSPLGSIESAIEIAVSLKLAIPFLYIEDNTVNLTIVQKIVRWLYQFQNSFLTLIKLSTIHVRSKGL